MIAELDENAIDSILKENILGRIGCSFQGFTYVVPISYAYDGVSVYGFTSHGLKVEIMRKNPEVCFEVDNTTDFANWRSVIAWGTYEELTTRENKQQALEKLCQRVVPLASSITMQVGEAWPFSSQDLVDDTSHEHIFFRIKLNKRTGRFETRSGKDVVGR